MALLQSEWVALSHFREVGKEWPKLTIAVSELKTNRFANPPKRILLGSDRQYRGERPSANVMLLSHREKADQLRLDLRAFGYLHPSGCDRRDGTPGSEWPKRWFHDEGAR